GPTADLTRLPFVAENIRLNIKLKDFATLNLLNKMFIFADQLGQGPLSAPGAFRRGAGLALG
ncbi:MAG: hypothetical protein LBS31_02275, partial [Candidatus Adiutrix sp.]|nr:hypothetical protein [Candidatus Adiutrix sp.]